MFMTLSFTAILKSARFTDPSNRRLLPASALSSPVRIFYVDRCLFMAALTIGKNLLNSNISPGCPYNVVNFDPLAAEIVSLVWGTPANFNGFRVLAALLHGI